jgi:hypothetical protein
MATDNPKAMTPTAAVARHLEWLEFALAAARDEEVRRQGRVERATDKNRQKRTVRLAEVTAEVRELAALVSGLKDLQAKATRSGSAAAGRSRASTAAKPKAATAAKAKPATAAKAKAPSTTRAKAPATRRAASKPAASAKAPATRRRTRTRSTRRTPPSA